VSRRHRARRVALQVLYGLDANPGQDPRALLEEVAPTGTESFDASYALRLVEGVREHRDRVDQEIAAASRRWRVDRMGRVDRNVLRLAVYEVLFCPETPAPVILDEAVRLAREFGTEDSPRFVNGVLDPIARRHRPAEARPAGEAP